MQNALLTGCALIVEDHPLYRDALLQLLRQLFDPSKVQAASSAEEALKLAESVDGLQLILVDPGLPGLNGSEAIAALRRLRPGVALVAISASEDRREAMAALRAGAQAFVSKAAANDVVIDIVRRLCRGEVQEPLWITPTGALTVTDELAEPALLTPRQREILALLCQGHGNKEIGLRLGLAEITVKMHVSAVFRALQVANRTQAVLAARRLGLVMPE